MNIPNILNAVSDWMKLLALLVLVAETVIISAMKLTPTSHPLFSWYPLFMLLFLVIIVIGVFIDRYTQRKTKLKLAIGDREVSVDTSQGSIEVISNPRILCACSPEHRVLGFDSDVQLISDNFPGDITTEPHLTGKKLRSLLINNNFDILHLLLWVTKDGTVKFSESDSIDLEGLTKLIEVSGANLVVLASCRSIYLATTLAGKVNMISAIGTPTDKIFIDWENIFYQLLSKEFPLSKSFETSRSLTKMPAVLILKSDAIFKKS